MEKIVTVCYGKRQEWLSRKKAEVYFLECMLATEGAEKERYTNIYSKLVLGETFCKDDDEIPKKVIDNNIHIIK